MLMLSKLSLYCTMSYFDPRD